MRANEESCLAVKELDLTDRIDITSGNEVFADNILLALRRLDSKPSYAQGKVDWEEVRKPFEAKFILLPGQVFAFHANLLPEFKGQVVQTLNSKFYTDEGYKSFAGLGGNGVCHLASLIDWAAKDAGLETTSKVDHDFYPVPGVPREHGVSINSHSAMQNLYVKNNRSNPVVFQFDTTQEKVIFRILDKLP